MRNPDGTQGYTWNPVTGCLNNCPYCYARKLANGRLKQTYLANKNVIPVSPVKTWGRLSPVDIRADITLLETKQSDPFYPRFWPERLRTPVWGRHKPRGIFVCDMGELFGDWIPEEWQSLIFETIAHCPQHRFYLLTKQPQNLINFSPFPANCYVGVSVTKSNQLENALKYLKQIEATVKFISFEPLLERINVSS